MKVFLVGYGKMGKTIEKIAISRGHEIAGTLENQVENVGKLVKDSGANIAIEFTQPEGAVKNILSLMEVNIPTVCGTTGWLGKWDEVVSSCEKNNGAFFYASNYSLGVNLFFRLNRALARLMQDYPEYKVGLKEIHHTEKKDAPSGTGITLAEGIQKERPEFTKLINDKCNNPGVLGIESFRMTNVPGTHSIHYASPIDEIEIKHTAFSREGFALGAVVAAEWLLDKKGVRGMDDLMGSKEGEKF
ncbi:MULTISPECIES: 4-hydroxy-tetrahydrodipicolinate reductase [unclassified Imperialibacter]|uniref:4-hydroxy-tetrahydrodipicolinate reductase n=1 Tax=unclassified Imperialibacter TaxID=2629706 RepID=UPI001256FDEC|nr:MULTISPECIES: 4-hydroxy-tetrahydrodipicolinate reductase [unclassified Imperialibacter]CAD5283359.1 4-hydroxy-tetrahydrodipicolinate reductase [Imperialibacter sp. 89]CAD5286196.1 4-hydroxy-tetrahydrodipicolinate reductase [Imperialibacter sp. 75]VVT29790.1 4-hydroxy-tetrahydrodipicolinate reductase [Imperialibacter sp. EC-SDR9]